MIPDQLLIKDEKCVGKDKPVTISEASSLISRATYPDCTMDDGIATHSNSNGMDNTQELLENYQKGQCTT